MTEVSPALPPLRDVINRHGLFASKALGQNFLFDEQLLDRIAAIPGKLTGAQVLEVGPGPGGLTRALLRAGAQVTAIEMDRRCLPALAELAEAFPGHLRVIEGDATKVPQDIKLWMLAHATQILRSPDGITGRDLQPMPFVDGLLDFYRVVRAA